MKYQEMALSLMNSAVVKFDQKEDISILSELFSKALVISANEHVDAKVAKKIKKSSQKDMQRPIQIMKLFARGGERQVDLLTQIIQIE